MPNYNLLGPEERGPYLLRLYEDPVFFAEQVWEDRKLDRKAPMGDCERDIVRFAALGPAMCGVLAPRGIGKTHLVSAVLAAWYLFRDAENKVLIPSKSETHAKKVIALIREWIRKIPFLQHLEPLDGQVDAATRFQVGPASESVQPSVTAIGIGGQLEGNRAHIIIPDDVETDSNTKTLESREELDERVKEFKDILYPDRPDSPVRIVYVGTYHHEDSVYLKLEKRGYKFQTWPICYPSGSEKVLNLAPMLARRLAQNPELAGTPAMPHRFDEINIAEKKSEGRRRFAMQHMLLSNLGEGRMYPLRLEDLIVMDVDPILAPLSVTYGTQDNNGPTSIQDIQTLGLGSERLYRPWRIDQHLTAYQETKGFVDPSGRGADETACCAIGHLAGYYWVKGLAGFPGGADSASLDQIAKFFRAHRATDLYYESNADTFDTYGPSLELAIQRHWLEPGEDSSFPTGWKASLTRVHNTGQKETRIIDTIEPVLSSHRLIIDRRAITPDPTADMDYQLQVQLSRITRDRKCLSHDDRIDALAGCLAQFASTVGMDTEKSAKRIKEFDIDRALEEHRGCFEKKQVASWLRVRN